MKIIWSDEATETYYSTIEFILLKWNYIVAEDFETEVNRVLNLISNNSKLFILSKKKGFHKAIISEQTSLIYKSTENQITLMAFVDNRSDHKF